MLFTTIKSKACKINAYFCNQSEDLKHRCLSVPWLALGILTIRKELVGPVSVTVMWLSGIVYQWWYQEYQYLKRPYLTLHSPTLFNSCHIFDIDKYIRLIVIIDRIVLPLVKSNWDLQIANLAAIWRKILNKYYWHACRNGGHHLSQK